MLAILDGWGWRDEAADNAVHQARTPNFDRLWAGSPHALLRTSGKDVGLPAGQMGNSEVGHLNIGAGRVVVQDLPRISEAIETGDIEREPALQEFIACLKGRGRCHLMGLVSPGGVHSHQNHAVGLARILSAAGVPTCIHVWTDGRDTPPQSAGEAVAEFTAALPPSTTIATVCGRYFAMDRDKRWDRIAKAYSAMVLAEGPRFASAAAVVADAYAHKTYDEFIVPTVVGDYPGMRDGDGVLSFNFRADRVREVLTAILDPAFTGFARGRVPAIACAAGMTEYSEELSAFMRAIFAPQPLTKILGEIVAGAGRTQLRAAETEKYPHVTYFLNGGREEPYPGEDRILVPSPKVATYDLKPEMSAPELTDRVVAAIDSDKYDLIVLNYANPDMVGHTGSLPAAIKAVEAVDSALGRIADAIGGVGGALLVTADHGNCELMRDPETGGPHTAHTTNPVPVLLTGGGNVEIADGRLADIAPTLLALMGLPQPKEMSGVSLLRSTAPERQKARA
jgi:2,3-bisphosphoglycerate-independent phosphoglycerate mutase